LLSSKKDRTRAAGAEGWAGQIDIIILKTVGNASPLISVVISCYNQAHFLAESIESVLSQTHVNREIIIIDDGSVDNPELVAAKYPKVAFIKQENQGVSIARNRGLSQSCGQFVVFLDADDRLLPNALHAGLVCFNSHPDCAFVFGLGRLIDSMGNAMAAPLQPPFNDRGYEELLETNPIAFPAIVMHRCSALESVGGFNSFVKRTFIANASDYDLYLRVASRFPIYGHDEVIAEWRQHATNTSRKSLLMLNSSVAVLKRQRERVKRNPRGMAALKKGLKEVGSHYGEQLIGELRSKARAGELEWLTLLRSIIALLKHYPEGLLDNGWRKAKVTVLGRPRQ